MKKIRVMIVEDSPVVMELLKMIIQEDEQFEIAAAVKSGEEALKVFEKASPDVISLDIRLPGINGFEVTRRIMSMRPTPIVVVSASVESSDLKISMNALRAGALTVIDKPVGVSNADYSGVARHLRTQLAIMSRVKLVRQRARLATTHPVSEKKSLPLEPNRMKDAKVLGVVASTGGPNALVTLFQGLGSDFPLPILLVQHITPTFLDGFVTWLNDVCPFRVKIAEAGEVPQPGVIYVPPNERHLIISGGRLRSELGPPVSSQRPSGTVLFQSMSKDLGHRGIGVLLTGMGDDGAQGLLDIRQAGGYTLVEDKSTAVVFGMPGVAVELGAACDVQPIDKIASTLLNHLSEPK